MARPSEEAVLSMKSLTRQERREKAERTNGAAAEIIRQEQAASEAKTTRLRELRAERDRAAAGARSRK